MDDAERTLEAAVWAAAEGTATAEQLTLLEGDPRAWRRMLERLLDETEPGADDRFARSLAELIATARGLETLDMYACSASVDLLGVEGEPLDGVLSTPRFLRETRGARLIFV